MSDLLSELVSELFSELLSYLVSELDSEIDSEVVNKSNNNTKKCSRSYDDKVFSLPRRFSKTKCLKGPIKGFTMRASCAPYKDC